MNRTNDPADPNAILPVDPMSSGHESDSHTGWGDAPLRSNVSDGAGNLIPHAQYVRESEARRVANLGAKSPGVLPASWETKKAALEATGRAQKSNSQRRGR